MKKKILFISLLVFVLGLSACLFEMDITVNQPVNFPIPVIPVPAFISTNIIAEIGVSNQGKGVFGDYATIKELRMDYLLSNNSSNSVNISIGVTAVAPITNGEIRTVNEQTYHTNGQTAWIVNNISLTDNQVYSSLYVSGDVDPLLRDILIQSNSYQVVIKTGVVSNGTVFQTNTINVNFSGKLSLDVQREQKDMPAIVSLFQ